MSLDLNFIYNCLVNTQKLKTPFIKSGEKNLLIQTFEDSSIYYVQNYGMERQAHYEGWAEFVRPGVFTVCGSAEIPDFPQKGHSDKESEFIKKIKDMKTIPQLSESGNPTGQNMAEHAGAEIIMSVVLMLEKFAICRDPDVIAHTMLVKNLWKYKDLIKSSGFVARSEFLDCGYEHGVLSGDWVREGIDLSQQTFNETSLVMSYVLENLDNLVFAKYMQQNGGKIEPEFQQKSLGNLEAYYGICPQLRQVTRHVLSKMK